jgi:5'-3' exonuclease
MAQKAKVVPENVVNYVMDIMEVLLAFGVKPVVVFDGKPLPAKQATYDKRQK